MALPMWLGISLDPERMGVSVVHYRVQHLQRRSAVRWIPMTRTGMIATLNDLRPKPLKAHPHVR
jgi:hypothetical protein